MNTHSEKINPADLEKEISEFLSKKFGNSVKIVSPMMVAEANDLGKGDPPPSNETRIRFDLKPEELIAYLDRFIVKQDRAKAVLATKICTHFNRIKRAQFGGDATNDMVGRIKNNVLLLGPTGVGKTYIVRLIAKKIGVPFVKGDATKFSETGYVGGDVEDLVRDLVREAGDDIQLAQYGIIYIDEIDKIAASRNLVGADVSRAGVQRALLKPMEETDVDLKVPHDPISMLQEIEQFRKTGKKERRVVNTGNILFIMSGAFNGLSDIVRKRVAKQEIGFGATIRNQDEDADMLANTKSEDLIAFGFESEFVGRLPVRAVLDPLTEYDLFEILKNPNNPIILGKRLDFAAYGIDIKFDEEALRRLARDAFVENTGARGLVSAVENALIVFEKSLPSRQINRFPVTREVIEKPEQALESLFTEVGSQQADEDFESMIRWEMNAIRAYLTENQSILTDRYRLKMTPSKMDNVAVCYSRNVMDIGRALDRIRALYDDIKAIELDFYKRHDINVILEEDAIDFVIGQLVRSETTLDQLTLQLTEHFELGLKLAMEKTARNRFFLNRWALENPEDYMRNLFKQTPSPNAASETERLDPT
ncbi:MAG: AAA family ATPase [Desulfobacterales bacterium]|jgi:endopeptidase Clp ATP-binding regulatory subunit ClpX